jgi:uncharacterized phiE125 gp8 family phage protein
MNYLKLITAPTIEPVTLNEVKNYLKIDLADTSQDTYLTALIKAVRESIEACLKRSLITQTWLVNFDYYSEKYVLQRPNIIAIASLKLTDSENTEHTIDSSNYFLKNDTLFIKDTYNLTLDLRNYLAVEIVYTAGYGATASNVPEGVKQGILEQIGSIFECSDNTNILSPKAKIFLDSYKAFNYLL